MTTPVSYVWSLVSSTCNGTIHNHLVKSLQALGFKEIRTCRLLFPKRLWMLESVHVAKRQLNLSNGEEMELVESRESMQRYEIRYSMDCYIHAFFIRKLGFQLLIKTFLRNPDFINKIFLPTFLNNSL